MDLSKEHEQILKDIGGVRSDGTPQLRIRTPEEAIYPHGRIQGQPKYRNPETGKAMEFLVIEMWIPPALYPDRDTWFYELLGPYPQDCGCSHCQYAMWGLKTPLTTNGEFLEVTTSLMESIKRKQFMDLQFSFLTESQRLEELDANLSARKQKSDEEGFSEYNDILDDYLIRKEKEDNADNRVFSFGDDIRPNFKNINLPIGRPKIKI